MKTKRIKIERLLFKPNATAGMNPFVLMSLSYSLRSSIDDPDPIVVKREGKFFRIMDGRHRVVAAMIAGRKSVLAIIEN